ncbi:protein of unknown function [Streptomyces sp. KY75]|nr:protein of unknown function [Streptomyces sp. KY70]CAD5975224.1 protein of unknown function [Streptomyces sp. KY75]
MWDRAITTERLNARPGEIRPLLLADSDALLRSGGPPEPVAEWAAAFPEHRPSARPRRPGRVSGSRAAAGAQVPQARLARSIDDG